MSTTGVVVVTFDALPWIERCLDSVRDREVVVVDNGSSDGTVELVRDRFPSVRLVARDNRGLAAGWNAGLEALRETTYALLLNADAWVLGEGVERLAAVADARPDAAVVGPRLLHPDGSLQRSARGFPTPWRLATEYLFLRKLAPRSAALNAFYAGGFDHDRTREVDWLMGAALLVRRAAVAEVGPADERFFLFSEETDWCYRLRAAGWKVVFTPEAEVAHVGGASHAGRFYVEQLRGHLRFLALHGGPRDPERARMVLLAGLALRSVAYGGARGAAYREGLRFLASGPVPALLER